MLIVISKITVRNGHFEKVIPVIKENAGYGLEKKGYIESSVSRGIENNNEILIYSRWQSQKEYEDAKKDLKKDPRSKKVMFQMLPHVTKHETLLYETIPLN